MRKITANGVTITVTHSAGTDGAVVVFIDGDVLKAEGKSGIRIHLNDGVIFEDTEPVL